ncbi:hypothetical protein ACTMU2_24710 [Cupriavidus basilensis]
MNDPQTPALAGMQRALAERVFNFSPGPAALPTEVLQQAAEEMLSWQGTGVSVMEMSHRSREFEGILAETFADLRELPHIPGRTSAFCSCRAAPLARTQLCR